MNVLFRNLSRSIFLAIGITGLADRTRAQESKLFEEFRTGQKSNKETILPDFSYAGNEYGLKLYSTIQNNQEYNVLDFGAIPNDG